MKIRSVSDARSTAIRWGLVALLLGAVALGVTPRPAHAVAAGTPLVGETFTGASADAEFRAIGSACLTGAPAAAPAGPGNHPLGGCPAAGTGPVPPTGAAPHGYLQLTDASHDQTAAVLYDHAVPANDGLNVTFDQWQYGSTTPQHPADGISFFLVDGAAALARPGAFGGSLGYAQKLPDDVATNPFLPGVERGYLGVGLDVLGNYFGDWEHRGNGCPNRSPAGTQFRIPGPGANMVTLRGPGDGIEGYCFLTATATHLGATAPWPSSLPGSLHGPTTSLPANATPIQAEQALEPSRRTVTVHISPAPDPVLTVSIDFHDGNGSRQVLTTPAPQPVPASYKFGFGASTGLFTDVHLIRNVSVSSATELPRLNLVKQVSQDPPLPAVPTAGTRIHYDYTVTNSGTVDITDLAVTDTRIPTVTCPTTTLAVDQTTTCHGVYTLTQHDVDEGHVTNIATATGTVNGTPVTSPPATTTLPLPHTALHLTKTVDHPTYRPGDTATYRYRVTNLTADYVTGLTVHDDRIRSVTCPVTTLAPAGQPGASTTCTGTHAVTATDPRRITNTAVAHAADGLASNPAKATITVRRNAAPTPTATPTHGALPDTGTTTGPALTVGLVLLGGGTLILLATTRRRRARRAGHHPPG